jgi:hypothetical protein
MRYYFPVTTNGPSDRLQKRVVDKYLKQVKTSINPAVTRGFAMALGYLPAKLLAPSETVLNLSLAILCKSSRPDAKVGTDKDAETRRNSLVALSRICKTVGVEVTTRENECIIPLNEKQVGHVFAALFRGLDDYNKERRGDVGSMSRIVAMQGLVDMALITTRKGSIGAFFSEEIATKIVGGLLKQLAEKLDAVRLEAGKCLIRILRQSDPPIPYIPKRKELLVALKPGDGSKTDYEAINWADSSVTFPLVMKVAQIDKYFDFIISGLVISVGCLTQSVSKHASAVLLQWVKEATETGIQRLGQGRKWNRFRMSKFASLSPHNFVTWLIKLAFLTLFEKHKHEGRVTQPLLKTIALLMDRVCIDRLTSDPSFLSSLCKHLREEEKGCKDVHRLTSIVNVSLGLLGPTSETEKEPLAFVCTMLMHRFPRVRRIAAENLYVRLLEKPDLDSENPALNLLLTNPWDGDEPEMKVKEMAMEVAIALDVQSLVTQ